MNRRAIWFAALALLASAVAGGALGFAAARRADGPREGPDVTLMGLSRGPLLDSLDLSTVQRQQVEALLDGASDRIRSRVDTMMADIRALTSETRAELRGLLTERQRARFDSLLATAPTLRLRTPAPPGRAPPTAGAESLPEKRAAPLN